MPPAQNSAQRSTSRVQSPAPSQLQLQALPPFSIRLQAMRWVARSGNTHGNNLGKSGAVHRPHPAGQHPGVLRTARPFVLLLKSPAAFATHLPLLQGARQRLSPPEPLTIPSSPDSSILPRHAAQPHSMTGTRPLIQTRSKPAVPPKPRGSHIHTGPATFISQDRNAGRS